MQPVRVSNVATTAAGEEVSAWQRHGGSGAAVVVALAMILSGCIRESGAVAAYAFSVGDPQQGRHLIFSYGCGSCHLIPGVPEATGTVGPPLDGFGQRAYIVGLLQNSPANLSRWVVNPQEVEPGTAMPELGVSPEQARHIAAYLYTLR